MTLIKEFDMSILPSYNNQTSKSQTKTLHKMLELMEINNAIQRHKSEPQFLMIALLSSFVTTARSVTFVMQKEYAHTNGFKEWYKQKQEIMKGDKEMQFFKELRTEIEHENNLAVEKRFHLKIDPPIEVGKTDKLYGLKIQYQQNGDFIVTDNHITLNDTKIPVSPNDIQLQYFFPKRKDKQARWLCLEHFQKLAKIVDECESTFKPTYHE